MIHAQQKSVFNFVGSKLLLAMLIVFCANFFIHAQVTAKTCDFSRYKPAQISDYLRNLMIEEVKPVYPPAARMVKAQGEVRVKIMIDRRGEVQEACVLDGHPLLYAAATDAARKTKFKPNFGLSRKYAKRITFLSDELVYNFTTK